METINTPYDDTFRTLLQDCPELVVPLINELFGTNYTGRVMTLSARCCRTAQSWWFR